MSYCGCRRRRRPLTPPGVYLLLLLFGWTKLNGSQARSIPINITYELQFSSTGYVRGRRRRKTKKKNLWFLTIFLCVNEFPFLLFFSLLLASVVQFSDRNVFGFFFFRRPLRKPSASTHRREKKKSGRAPYWFVSPFNNISVLIDTKEEKIRIFSLPRQKKTRR